MLLLQKHTLRGLFCWFILFFPFILRGQIKPKGEDQTKDLPLERIIKLSPLALIDPFGPTIAAYYEQQLPARRHWHSLEVEAGYTFQVAGLTEAAKSYRLRTSYRYYLSSKWKRQRNHYTSIAFLHRQFFDQGAAFVWRENRSFQQNLPYHLRISQQSLTLNIGTTRYFGMDERFNIDLGIGLGLRRTRILFTDLPSDAVTPNIPDIFERNFKEYIEETTVKDRNHLFYSTVLAVKLGYILQKNRLASKQK
ncbi:MAG: hypothetical protein JNL70_10265 [Saprospiraceae bacterium]|nr:hypothetical protein [Saprospiraceae bacterium]